MTFLCRPCYLAVVATLFCASCGDDPKLVEKREQQKAEISRLKGELAMIDEQLKSLPPDVTADLAEARQLSEKQSAEVAALETEVAELDTRKRALQKEFEAYQAKYRVK